ncbi:Protein phosphatase 2C [uncultured virus]|nr:Protein phosphatase 2C [uncultured virus]
MNIHTASLKGLRESNEDKHFILANIDNKNPLYTNINFFAVFDGHGGKIVSEFLAKKLPTYFIDKKCTYPLSKLYVHSVYDRIQKSLIDNKFAQYCGSTALAVIQYKINEESYINVINVGDCRCIICRDNFAMPLTKDHKPGWIEERHRIEAIGGQIIFDGYDYRIKDLSVSRAFGDIDATPYVTHKPELFRYKLDKNDKFILLACDGCWDILSNQDAVNYVLSNCYDNTTKNRINKEVNIAKKLAEYAIKKGSTDNVSIIVIFLK